MKFFQSFDHFHENCPNFLLFDHLRHLLVFKDLLIEVSIVQEIHHETEAGSLILEKRLLVTDNTRVPIFKWIILSAQHLKTDCPWRRLKVNLAHFLQKLWTYCIDARIRTSLRAFSFSFGDSLPILTYDDSQLESESTLSLTDQTVEVLLFSTHKPGHHCFSWPCKPRSRPRHLYTWISITRAEQNMIKLPIFERMRKSFMVVIIWGPFGLVLIVNRENLILTIKPISV